MPRSILLGLLVLLTLASPAGAAPRWLDAELPFGDAPALFDRATAVTAPDGTVLVARLEPDGALEVRERPPGGSFGATTTLPRVAAGLQVQPRLQVLLGADGTAAVLFDVGGVRFASLRPPGGDWTNPDPVSPAGAGAGQAAVAPDGVLWVVARAPDDEDHLAVYRMTPGHPVETTRIAPGAGRHLGPVLTVPRAGTAHVAFVERDVTADDDRCAVTTALRAVDVPAHGEPGPVATLDAFRAIGLGTAEACDVAHGDSLVAQILLASDEHGADTLVFTLLGHEAFTTVVLGRHREPGGDWRRREFVSDEDVVAERLIGGTGAPVVVVRSIAGKAVATRSGDGDWTPLQRLVGGEDASTYDAARTGTGTVAFAWVERLPVRLVGRVLDASGALGAPTTLAPESFGASVLAVGGDAEGNASALTSRPNGPAFRLHLNAYDAAGPRLVALRLPEHPAAGVQQVFSVDALDVWAGREGGASWDFGDGERGEGFSTPHVYGSAGTRTVSVRLRDPSGNETSAAAILPVAAGAERPTPPLVRPTAPPPPPPPPPRDLRAPVVEAASLAGRSPRLRLTTDEAGEFDVTLTKVASGVRRGGRCVARTRARSGARGCTRTLVRRSVAGTLAAGTRRIALPRLSRGTWTINAVVTDAAGNTGRARVLRVRVVR